MAMEHGEHSARRMAAAQIVHARQMDIEYFELSNPFTRNRSGLGYLDNLHGLHSFFHHVGKLPTPSAKPHAWLDVGAGTTRGVWHLSKSEWMQEYNILPEATILARHPIINKYFGFDRTHITSVEALRGIADGSISAITGSGFSIDYGDPYLAAKSMWRVLEPGGLIKASISGATLERELRKAGFIVATYTPNRADNQKLGLELDTSILLAAKPGGPESPTEETLEFWLAQDRASLFVQAIELQRTLKTKGIDINAEERFI